MQFFIPELTHADRDIADVEIRKYLSSLLRCEITDRKIFSLTYIHDKKTYHAEVGQKEELENNYQIVAIYEANVYIVCTQDGRRQPSHTILVNKDEVTVIEEFSKL
jgi:hypothetical protein